MPRNFDTDEWFLAAGINRGIGRSWLVTFHYLTDIEPAQDYMAAPNLDAAKRWALECVKGQAPRARIYWERARDDGQLWFGYVHRKHVEMDNYAGSSRW